MSTTATSKTGTTTNTTSATDFATVGRILKDVAAHHNGKAPGFRSPPRIPGVVRSVTRNRDGSVTVAVAVRNRPLMAVVSDMIDGVLLTSGSPSDGSLRDALWTATQLWIQQSASEQKPGPKPRHLRVAA